MIMNFEQDLNYCQFLFPVYTYMSIEEKERLHAYNEKAYNDMIDEIVMAVPSGKKDEE